MSGWWGRWVVVAVLGSAALSVGCSSTTNVGDTAGDGTGGGGSGTPECETYCETVQENCTGEFEQYVSVETCLGVCATMNVGTTGDELSNTLGCRQRQAELAGSTGEPDQHCKAAGPAGADVCGENCDGFCVILMETCSAASSEFNGVSDCREKCRAEIPDLNGSYDVSISSGDSVQCRLWHVSAATLDPDIHCTHALGNPPCTD